MSNLKSIIRDNKEKIFLLGLFLFFLIVRLPGISLPYHQDEMKTAIIMEQGFGSTGGIHHPPLTHFIYSITGLILDDSFLRLMPILFSTISFFLLFLIVKRRVGIRSAFFSIFIFVIATYSVWASLMLDTDGAILPALFLGAVYFYDLWISSEKKYCKFWFSAFLITVILGLLVKLSFIIAIGAFALDYLLIYRNKINKKTLWLGFSISLGILVIFSFLLILINKLYPTFEIKTMVSHAWSFVDFSNRNYLQIIIQGIKAIFYSSPLLLIPLLFTSKEVFKSLRLFFIKIILGLIFYFVIFDFGEGALDKYLMFLVVPLSVIAGSIFGALWPKGKDLKLGIILGLVISILIFILNFLPHTVLSLYPKTEWFFNVMHLKWNILFPLTGGSGPLGFYMSFLFISISFLISIFLALLGLFKKRFKGIVLVAILIIGLVYNLVFVSELLFGKINGHSSKVLSESLEYIRSAPNVKGIITYGDSGAFELQDMAKYFGRFYAVPSYEEGHRVFFEKSRDGAHFLVVDVPHLYETGFYHDFFKKCNIIHQTRSGQIVSFVYDCSNNIK